MSDDPFDDDYELEDDDSWEDECGLGKGGYCSLLEEEKTLGRSITCVDISEDRP